MKVEKIKKSVYILGYQLELIIKVWLFEKIYKNQIQNLVNLGHFFHGKSFV